MMDLHYLLKNLSYSSSLVSTKSPGALHMLTSNHDVETSHSMDNTLNFADYHFDTHIFPLLVSGILVILTTFNICVETHCYISYTDGFLLLHISMS